MITNFNNELLTVVMSVYNGEKYLKEAIQSILKQTFADFNFLIINDGSTDLSREIILSFKDNRIKLIDNKKNIGLTRSLNKALNLAEGKYIARMDADDISKPNRFKEQIDYLLSHPDIGLLGTSFDFIDENGIITGKSDYSGYSSEILYYTLTFYNCIAHSTVIFNKELVLSLGGYDETILRSQDIELWYRISRKARVQVVNKSLVELRNINTNISNRYKSEQDEFAKKIFYRNIDELMGESFNIHSLLCFHDEGFSERHPLNVTLNNIIQLIRFSNILYKSCPSWLNQKKLKLHCRNKILFYIRYIVAIRLQKIKKFFNV
jgi:Glycosyltransferases involved in cell wall biogenesis